jgi:hypothetical protein
MISKIMFRARFLFVLAFLFLSVSQSYSQVLIALVFGDKLNSPKMKFGLNVGINVSDFSDLENSKYRGGLQFGLFVDYKLNDRWIFRPELNAITNVVVGIDPYITGNAELDTVLSQVDVERKINYGSAAVLFKYLLGNKWELESGPRGSLRFKAQDIFTADVFESEDLVFTRDIKDEVTRLDVGWTVGIGRTLFKGKGVYFSIRYYYGFVDVLKDVPDSQNVSSFQFNASIPIVGKKQVDKKLQEGN